jgi:hypothetical protein
MSNKEQTIGKQAGRMSRGQLRELRGRKSDIPQHVHE